MDLIYNEGHILQLLFAAKPKETEARTNLPKPATAPASQVVGLLSGTVAGVRNWECRGSHPRSHISPRQVSVKGVVSSPLPGGYAAELLMVEGEKQ